MGKRELALADNNSDEEVHSIGKCHQPAPIGCGKQTKPRQDQFGNSLHRHVPEDSVIDEAAHNQRVQIPIRPHRLQENLLQQYGRSDFSQTFAYGQEVRHHRIARLHASIRDENPEEFLQKTPGVFVDIGQISGDNQEGGHVESIDYLLGIGVFVAYVYQVENNHQGDENTFQVVYLFDAGFHDARICFLLLNDAKIYTSANFRTYTNIFMVSADYILTLPVAFTYRKCIFVHYS